MGKTAVIIIHGVGEQRPMGTVSRFTQLFAGNYFRSKPDRGTRLFELRRLSTFVDDPGNQVELESLGEATTHVPGYPPNTVFFEFYWAFHYRDTKPAAVIRWALRALWKLFRGGQCRKLGRRAISMATAYVIMVSIFLLAVMLVARGVSQVTHPEMALWWGTLYITAGVALPWIFAAFKPFLIGWAGDAARYFGISPDNPIERQQIREEGIALLKRLHDEEDDAKNLVYENIVLVGHSLGSVIAYDIILNYWTEINRDIEIEDGNADLKDVLERIEDLADEYSPPANAALWRVPDNAPTAEQYQALQKQFVDLLRKSNRVLTRDDKVKGDKARAVKVKDVWRIRDLVTLGSPLTYSRFLLADSAAELFYRQRQRELPTCPPTKDQHKDERGIYSFVFRFSPIMPADCVVPDQTAPFLLTCWTNLYFPQDPIGGPLRPILGWGIRDVKVNIPRNPRTIRRRRLGRWLRWAVDHFFGGAHVRYWELIDGEPKNPVSADCAHELRRIVTWSPLLRKLQAGLVKRFPTPATVKLEVHDGIIGVITSAEFAGMKTIDRQNLIAGIIEANLSPVEGRQVQVIEGLTPDEGPSQVPGDD